MEWTRFVIVIGDRESIDVHHMEERFFSFNHRSLVTDSNVQGEYSSTRREEVLKLAGHIAQTGGLG